jgi:hypothetical protein
MPDARCTRSLVCAWGSKYAHEYSQRVTGNHPAFPAQWFTAYTRALPGDRLFCHRRQQSCLHRLDTASGCQDHTSSPSALASPVKRAVASTAARPASVTFAKRPSEWDGMAVNVFLIFRIVKRNILRDRRTRRITLNPLGKLVFAHSGFSDQNFCAERPIHSRINPSGKSVDDSDVPRLSPCRPAERPDPTPGVRDQRRISNGYERREPLNSEWSATSASVRIPDSSRTPHKGPKSAQSRSLPRLEKRRSGHFQPELSATRSQ